MKGRNMTDGELRIKKLMERAAGGDDITVGFLGGSITQGSLASREENCYAACVYEWWKEKFPQSRFSYINAGIGGTTSLFGAARAQEDLLKYEPDFVIVDFTVNDEPEALFKESFEGVIRQVYYAGNRPAVMVLNNVFYDSGINAEDQHNEVTSYYEIPSVSMKRTVYQMIQDGVFAEEELTADHLHPNDRGHRLIASILIGQLERIYRKEGGEECLNGKQPLTINRFEHARRYQIDNCHPARAGFRIDVREKHSMLDLYKKGWTGKNPGDSITFSFEGSFAAVQFLRSVRRSSPAALAVIDGNEAEAVLLDGNFDEDWGDCLYLQHVLDEPMRENHVLEIKIADRDRETENPFYLVSVITD